MTIVCTVVIRVKVTIRTIYYIIPKCIVCVTAVTASKKTQIMLLKINLFIMCSIRTPVT